MRITPETQVNEILGNHPEAVRLLNELGLDTCCGGGLPLKEAESWPSSPLAHNEPRKPLGLKPLPPLVLPGQPPGPGLGAWPSFTWKPAHAHLQLIGFVGQMIFGVAYHALPRFQGVVFRRTGLALLQVGLSNLGLVGLTLAWGLSWPGWAFGAFGGLEALSAFLFAGLMLEVLWR